MQPPFTLLAQAETAAEGASDLRVVLIGAGAAVVGSLVGGAVTGIVTLRAERQRQTFAREDRGAHWEREEARAASAAQASARLLHAQVVKARVFVSSFQTLPAAPWVFLRDMPGLDLAHEDRRLIAETLSPEDWYTVLLAEHSLAILGSLKDRSGSMSSEEARELTSTLGHLRAAQAALDNLAGLGDVSARAWAGLDDEPPTAS